MQKRFEHKVDSIGVEDVEHVLHEREKDGWELVAATQGLNIRDLYFKRPVETIKG